MTGAALAVRSEVRTGRAALYFLAPALVVLALLLAYPVIYSIWLSLTDAKLSAGKLETPFVGLDNYIAMATDKAVRNALFNTLYFTVVEVAGVLILGLLTALLLNHPLARWSGYRCCCFCLGDCTCRQCRVVKWIYHSNYGILNSLLLQLGLIDRNVTWLGSPFSP